MGQFKMNINLWLDAKDSNDVSWQLQTLLEKLQWEMCALEAVDQRDTALMSQATGSKPMDNEETRYVTFRVADEKFRVFARDFGFQGTELKVAKNKDFLQFRVRTFLESLGYQVEPRTNIRVVSESHAECGPIHESVPDSQQDLDNLGEFVYIKGK